MLPEEEMRAMQQALRYAPSPKRSPSRLGCLARILLPFVLGAVAVWIIAAVFAPWAFFLGGHTHLLPGWKGWGRMRSQTGADYFLYVNLYPSKQSSHVLPGWSVKGTGSLCTPKGESFRLILGGGMPRTFRVHSLGKPITLYLYNWRETWALGRDDRPRISLSGTWGDAKLVMDDRKSLAAAFLPDGTLRPRGSPVPAQREDIQVTLEEGRYSDFQGACRGPAALSPPSSVS